MQVMLDIDISGPPAKRDWPSFYIAIF